jgi:hypothetical protein
MWEGTGLNIHRKYFDWIAEKFQVNFLEDWYVISREMIGASKGLQLLENFYDNSLFIALETVYPQTNWLPWKFQAEECRKAMNRRTFRRSYLDWIEDVMEMKDATKWYEIKRRNLMDHPNFVEMLDRYYNGSLFEALNDIKEEFHWEPWRFGNLRGNFWDKLNNQVDFFLGMANDVGIKCPEDWTQKLHSLEGIYTNFLRRYHGGSLLKALRSNFPEYSWEKRRVRLSKGQKMLAEAMMEMLGSDYIVKTDQEHIEYLQYSKTNKTMQLDVFVPQINLALEYQGEQHYHQIPYFGTNKLRDQISRHLPIY